MKIKFCLEISIGFVLREKELAEGIVKKFHKWTKSVRTFGDRWYNADRRGKEGFTLPEKLPLFSIYSFLSGR
jgi:hypothetical protein